MPTDDKKKKAASKGAGKEALKSALAKAPATGKMQKTKKQLPAGAYPRDPKKANTFQKRMRNEGLSSHLETETSGKYKGRSKAFSKTRKAYDETERTEKIGAKKVKVKVKPVATKKASPVDTGRVREKTKKEVRVSRKNKREARRK